LRPILRANKSGRSKLSIIKSLWYGVEKGVAKCKCEIQHTNLSIANRVCVQWEGMCTEGQAGALSRRSCKAEMKGSASRPGPVMHCAALFSAARRTAAS
jgi:hypothetical protein